MKIQVLAVISALFVFSGIACAQQSAFNRNAVVKILKYDNVEMVNVKDSKYPIAVPNLGHGTGTVIDGSGIILTNAHVVEDARFLCVLLPGRDIVYPAEVIYSSRDEETGEDYAFISIDGIMDSVQQLPKTAPRFRQDQEVRVWGYPMDFEETEPSVIRGVISREWSVAARMAQMDAPINHGNSGGPVVDEKGNIIGIATAGRDESEGIKYFMPVQKIIAKYAELLKTTKIQDVKKGAREMAADKKQLRSSIMEYLVELNKGKKNFIRGQFGSKMEKLMASLDRTNVSQMAEEMGDIAALAAAFYYNQVIISCLLNEKPLTQVETKSCAELLGKALQLANKAVTIDPSLQTSGFLRNLNQLCITLGCDGSEKPDTPVGPLPYTPPQSRTQWQWDIEAGYLGISFDHLETYNASAIGGGYIGAGYYYVPQHQIYFVGGVSFLGGAYEWENKPGHFIAATGEFGLHAGTMARKDDTGVFLDAMFMLIAYTIAAPVQDASNQTLWGIQAYYDTFHIRVGYVFSPTFTLMLNYRNLPAMDYAVGMVSASVRL